MAEMVGSLVVGEVVNRTSSFLISRHRERERLTTWEAVERLEMAHIKMEAALDVSSRWQTADASLLRWRRKLRRTAEDCDAAVHCWKLRALEEEAARESLARAPFRRRVAHAVLSFVRALRALARGGNDEVARACAAVRRFERLANGSAEFLRCVQLGSSASSSRKYGFVGPAVVQKKLGNNHANHNLAWQGARRGLLGDGSEDWVGSKRCSPYRKRRASGKKLLLA